MCVKTSNDLPTFYPHLLWIFLCTLLLVDCYDLYIENRELSKKLKSDYDPLVKVVEMRLDKLEKVMIALLDAQRFREDILYNLLDKENSKKSFKSWKSQYYL